MIRLEGVSVGFGERSLFSGVDWQINEDSRVGLIGVNGSGKSTLLKTIAGKQEVDSGRIVCAKHFTVGYLPQELHTVYHKTVFEEALSGCGTAHQIRVQWEEASRALQETDHDSEDYNELVMEFSRLQHLLEEADGFSLEAKTSRVLQGLGIPEEWWKRQLSQLSGGWQMRVELAKLILLSPSLLLLDEPTNHLDVESILWLSAFLKSYEGGMVIISHDRYFLDENTRQSVEIWNGKLHFYAGNYSRYVVEKQQRLELLENAYRNQQEEIARTQQFIDRFRYKATKAKQAQSRIKMLEKMERIELPQDTDQIRLRIPHAPRSGRTALEAAELGHNYGGKPVFSGLSFKIERGEKIALVGVNGAGKTTLLKILSGSLAPAQGHFALGHNVIPAYYAQIVTDHLNLQNTILDEISLSATTHDETQLRSVLGSFLFSGDDVYKKISVLSGGEKSRVALGKILLKPSNLLLLDEPTNHLDMNSKQIFLDALKEYEGAILFISHDRYFMDQLAAKVLELKDGKLTLYLGSYSEYLAKVTQQQTPIAQRSGPAEESSSYKSKDRKRIEAEQRKQQSKWKKEVLKPLEDLEITIAQKEQRLAEIEKVLADNETYADRDRFHAHLSEHKKLKTELEAAYRQWEQLQKRKEEFSRETSL